MTSSYEWVDHTAEVELRIDADSEEAVFRQAFEALTELLAGANGEQSKPVRHDVTVSDGDRAGLLVQWLEELIFLAETRGFVPDALEELALGADGLRARVAGRRGDPSALVKAVTYHGLELRRERGRWYARVVLDV